MYRPSVLLAAAMVAVCLQCAGTGGNWQVPNWKVEGEARLVGRSLLVQVPDGMSSSAGANAEIDLSSYSGAGVAFSIRVRGKNVSKSDKPWLGFKFMCSFKEMASGRMQYPDVQGISGTFGWRELTLEVDLTDKSAANA